MSVGCGRQIDGTQEVEHLDETVGTQIEDLWDHGGNPFVGDSAGTEGIYGNGDGLGHAYGVGHLDLTALGKSCRHDIFGHIASGIGC